MKKITILLLGMFAIINLQAQNYYIDFTASGTTTTLDSVFVENLTQGTSLTLQGSDTLHLYGTAGISSHGNNSSELKIYPNPFNETSHFEFYSETPTIAGIDVYDVVGKHIVQLRQNIQKGDNIFEISGFPTGHYQLIVKTEIWHKSASFISLNTGNQNPQIELKSTFLSEGILKSTTKSAKNIIQMPYTTGDEMRFVGFSGQLSETLNDEPISSKTIDFLFTSTSCGNNITFNYNGASVTYGTVLSNGRCWLDRNLGATQVATSSTDANAYGHLYQWGRGTDGHQIRTSGTISTLSNSDTPGHANFILAPSSPYDWRTPQNPNLWQGVSGVNNPCPTGWRVPTEAEWNTERLSWSTNNSAGAFASPLKLPVAGVRSGSDGSLSDVGSFGGYWSSTVGGASSRVLGFFSSDASMHNGGRAYGFSVRCLKDN